MPKISMTVQRLKSLKAIGGKRTEYQDNKTEGLGLRVTPTGAKSWFMLYYRQSDKKKRRLTLGKYPALGLADARTKAREFLTAIEQGQDPAGQKQEDKRADTFEELAGFYIERYAKKKKRTWRYDLEALNRELLPVLGGMKANQITKKDIIRIIDSINDRGAGVYSNRVLEIIRKIFNWACEEDLQEFNPALGIRKRHIEEDRTRVLNPIEIKQLWDRLDSTNATLPVKQIIKLCLMTGQRVGEVSGCPKSEIDLQGAMWQLPKERTKNKLPHAVPLAPMALELFRTAIAASNSPFVFPSPRTVNQRPITAKAAVKMLNRHKAIIQIDDLNVHDLRRTVINHMLGEVLDIDDAHVSYVMNHVSFKNVKSTTLGTYDQNKYNHKKIAALELWESYLSSIIEGTDFNIVPFNQINQAG